MSGENNLIGQKFGLLTVMSVDHTGTHGKEYLCKCECGSEKVYRGSTLKSGRVSGCGCLKGKSNSGKVFDAVAKSHIGEIHGKLKIVDIDRIPGRGYQMICECSCGNTVKSLYSDLSTGKLTSCGCNVTVVEKQNEQHVNSTWHFIRVNGERIDMCSGYEVMYAMIQENNNVKWLYKPQTFTFEDGTTYIPTFQLVETDEWIDVNYRHDKEQQKQRDKFKQLGHTITVINQDYIQREMAYSDYKFRRRILLNKSPMIIKRDNGQQNV